MTDRRMRFSNLNSGFKLAYDDNSKVDTAYSIKEIPHARKRVNLDLLPSFKGCDGVFDTSDRKVERKLGLKCNIQKENDGFGGQPLTAHVSKKKDMGRAIYSTRIDRLGIQALVDRGTDKYAANNNDDYNATMAEPAPQKMPGADRVIKNIAAKSLRNLNFSGKHRQPDVRLSNNY